MGEQMAAVLLVEGLVDDDATVVSLFIEPSHE